LRATRWCRWVLADGDRPCGRVAAFAPAARPEVGYFGFFECPDDAGIARALLGAAEAWLAGLGRREVYGPVAVTPRDRIGLLIEGFERPALLFTPYNPPYYARLLESAGYTPAHYLRAYGWQPGYRDDRGVVPLAERVAARAAVRVRTLDPARLGEETRLVVQLVNQTLAGAWHFEPISESEAARLAALLGPVLDPSIALVAEDHEGPCAVFLAIPDVWWLWRRAGGALWPFGWARLLQWRRRIPQARVMALGALPRARRTGTVAQLIGRLDQAGRARGYRYGELSQVYEDNHAMRRVLDRMRLPVVRRYAVYARRLEA
ncbi:MAG TPA: hypothetical protein VFU46_14260, partial [Gemmatimonadales bacterium]|nr:hypothetical protein [Gemmatimonadales bacterium]